MYQLTIKQLKNMKNMKKMALLLLGVAAGMGASAQTTIKAMACEALTLTATAATGTGTMSYQWYADGSAIAGCATQNCTVAAANAAGTVVYKRTVVSSGCPADPKETTTITVHYQGRKVGSVCWAPVNVGNTNKWTQKPDDLGGMFQWNRSIAWHPTSPAAEVPIPGWEDDSNDFGESEMWEVNPCPSGWRLPATAEYQALYDASIIGTNGMSGFWVAANAKGNAVAGKFFGATSATCTLATTAGMANCIFLPAASSRSPHDGALENTEAGWYWTSTPIDSRMGEDFSFMNDYAAAGNHFLKSRALSVRCVKSI